MNHIIQLLFKSFSTVFESNDTQHRLETFCKTIKTHNKNLGFFIQCYDAKLLNHWLTLIKKDSIFKVIQLNTHSADILIVPSAEYSDTLFNFITSWQSTFVPKSDLTSEQLSEQKSSQTKLNSSLASHFNESYQWIHSWMSEYLSDFSNDNYVIKNTSPKLLDEHIIHAIGLQQNIKQSLSCWNKQDSTWWQNIKPSALAIACLSHNIVNQQSPLKIQFELLTSDTVLNPKVKFEQLLNKQDLLNIQSPKAIQSLFLNFELNCLNACTFCKPYKLIYAIIEFERVYTKLSV